MESNVKKLIKSSKNEIKSSKNEVKDIPIAEDEIDLNIETESDEEEDVLNTSLREMIVNEDEKDLIYEQAEFAKFLNSSNLVSYFLLSYLILIY